MRIPFVGIWAAAVTSAAMHPLFAQDAPNAEARIARLIERLGAHEFAVRSAADAELAELGKLATAALLEAAESNDAEVRVRARALLWKLKVAQLWAGSPVKLADPAATTAELLQELTQQTGNKLIIGDRFGEFTDGQVRLTGTGPTFWQVLDDVCRQSGNTIRPHYDTRELGWVVTRGDIGQFPVAYAGPVRAVLTSATRLFSEELDYRDGDAERVHTFQLKINMIWEGSFRLVACREQPELVAAVTDTAARLSAGKPSGTSWTTLGRKSQQHPGTLQLEPPPVAAERLERLTLRWPMIAVGEMTTLDIDDPREGATYYDHDAQLQVVRIEETGSQQVSLTLLVTRDLVVPDPQEILFQENEFELFDAQGRAFRKQGQTNSLAEGGAQIKINFLGRDVGAPKTLRFTYPRIRSRRDLEITFRDVPLPTGRPE